MEISPKALEEFKEIWKKQFGEEISDKDAHEEASSLLRLFKVIYRPLPEETEKNNNSSKNLSDRNID